MSAADQGLPPPAAQLDLRGTPCPLNYIRSKLALEKLQPGEWLQVDLDLGEPEQMVADGLRCEGHQLERQLLGSASVRLLICRAGGAAASGQVLPSSAAAHGNGDTLG
ncbi:MAG: hypothetical protein RLZZ611_2656 [Cyanobacteriota bacterium]